MAMHKVTRFNVEKLNRNGTAFYLTTFAGEYVWSTDPDAALEFRCEDEAQEAADEMYGEVMTYHPFRSIPDRPRDEPVFHLVAAE